MPTDKIILIDTLKDSLDDLDWSKVSEIYGKLIAGLHNKEFDLTDNEMKTVLVELRRKCRYDDLAVVAEAVLWIDPEKYAAYRFYAQATD